MHAIAPNLPRRAARAGFTLVELLVVIGIIALLISILLPSLNKARRSAAAVQCSSNTKQIAMAVLQYANNHKGKLMPIRVTETTTAWPTGFFWANELVRGKYIVAPNAMKDLTKPDYFQNSIFKCPEGIDEMNFGKVGLASTEPQFPADARNNVGFFDDYWTNPDTGAKDFGIATWYQPVGGTASATSAWPAPTSGLQRAFPFVAFSKAAGDGYLNDIRYSRTLSQMRRAAQLVMLVEANQPNWISKGTAPHLLNRLAARHGSKTTDRQNAMTNFAFFDGHVGVYPTKPLDEQYLDNYTSDTVFFLNNNNR